MFDSATISVPCPSCGYKSEKSIGWLKSNDHLRCAGCGKDIALDADELRSGLKSVEDSLADIKRSVQKLGK